MKESGQHLKNTEKNMEINIIDLIKTIWINRRTIISTVIFFTIIGLTIALFSNKQYTASATLVPQINSPSGRLGGLSSLASLAGFNLDINSDAFNISPILYPKIINSTSFQLEIMNAKYYFEELQEPETLYNYYMDIYKPGIFEIIKKYTLGVPSIILKGIRKKKIDSLNTINTNTIKLTEEQNEIRKSIEEKIKIEINDKEGYLILISKFHQPSLSAQVAQKAQKLLQDYITNLKTEKALSQLEFIEARYYEKKDDFELAQAKLAEFRDANKNITSSLARTEEERLEYEYQLAFDIYSELAKQVEQARIKVKEDAPVFSVIQEVNVPIEKSKPKRLLILTIWISLGAIIGVGVIFLKQFLSGFRKQWYNE